MKRTPLYDEHIALGGNMVDFGGWNLPIQYTGIVGEHKSVRAAAGLFDVSHMGEISISGPDAGAFMEYLITNDISGLGDNEIAYSPMCNKNGGTVDDLLIYRYSKDHYLLVVNAANIEKDWQYINENSFGRVKLENISDKTSQLAIQGPQAQEILSGLTDADLNALNFYCFYPQIKIAGKDTMISRTGYTGEDGFELYIDNKDAPALWKILLEHGKDKGLVPVGLGARDTLRFEAALPLYGHELSESISPVEAGLGIFVKIDKPGDFLGKAALTEQKINGPKRKLVGLEMTGRGLPRKDCQIAKEGQIIGYVTSGSFSPSTGKNFAMGLVSAEYAVIDSEVEIIIRDKPVEAKVIRRPFIAKKYKK